MKAVKLIRAVAAVGIVVFLAMIVRSSLEMNIWAGLLASTDTWWGALTLLDVYTGLWLFAAYIAYRERSVWRTALWFVALVTLGNLATLAYVFVACGRVETVEGLFRPVPER
ncbi:MAG: DUF1475 family protein [Phycisphaerales bacterium]|nr:DUF1475 family protein [Phycisphaerales bacterium]